MAPTPTKSDMKGPFIYYVITFLGFLDPPPPLHNHVFSTENNKKLAISGSHCQQMLNVHVKLPYRH